VHLKAVAGTTDGGVVGEFLGRVGEIR